MERMLRASAPEEAIPSGNGHGAFRGTLYIVLLTMLVASAWIRFNDQISALIPGLAGPAAQVADQLGLTAHARGLAELGLVSQHSNAEAVAAMGLGAGDAALLSDALQKRRLRLVQMPVFDFSPTVAADGAGHEVQVSSGGYTRLIRLTRAPVTLTLPIAVAGTVTFRAADGDPVNIGALTLSGPIRLPELAIGQTMSVGVLAE